MEMITTSPTALGQAIRRIRKAKHLTQEVAGKPFRIEQRTVSTIEQGFPGTRIDTLFRMLAALDLEMVIRTKERPHTRSEW